MNKALWIRAMIGGLWLACAVGGPARAGVAVSPLKQEVTVKPGETGKVTISLSNHSRSEFNAVQSVRLEVVDVQVIEDGSIGFLQAGLMDSSASKWVSLPQTSLMLEPNQSQPVECTIVVPASAPPGEYYTTVMVTLDTTGRTDKGVAVQYRIASGIFVTVPGRTYPKRAKIERCEFLWPEDGEAAASQPAASEPNRTAAGSPASQPTPVMPRVSVLLHNSGRARFEASGKVKIVDGRSRVVFAGSLSSPRACVFGGDSRLFEAALAKPLAAGKYVIKVEMDYESTWSKARHQMSVEILPQQAAALQLLAHRRLEGQSAVEVQPEKVSVSLRPGAMRSLGLAAKNTSDGPVRAGVRVVTPEGSPAGAWMTVQPQDFTISAAGHKTVGLKVQVPADAPTGTYQSAVVIQAAPEGLPPLERTVPVEIEVKAEK